MRYYPWVIQQKNREAMQEAARQSAGLASLFPQPASELQLEAGLPAGTDVGAQVGFKRNLEFSAGGRSHRLSTGSYTRA
jgi:hypothetical protein